MENTTRFILQENALTNNTLLIANVGYVFKGGYVAVIREYFYANEWSDREVVKKFRTLENLNKYLDKKYPNFNCEL